QDIDYRLFSGIRVDAGIWLDCANRYSLDANAFWMPTRTQHFLFTSDAAGSPLLARPFINALKGSESGFLTAFPWIISGKPRIDAEAQISGGEFNGRYHYYTTRHFQAEVLAGFRYLRLEEQLRIQDTLFPLQDGVLTFLGAGNSVNAPNFLQDQDLFKTTNQFYGFQVGGKLYWCWGRFFLDLNGKLALGVTEENVRIDGSTSVVGPGGVQQTATGGILALPTNIGSHFRTPFSAVGEMGFNFGVDLCSWARLQAGY